ncbi:MAG: hypothetical protein GC159_07280 [Phycisphaera sp.]|nr:hypothetical protein [Phycisphaera sp.]
MAHPSPLEAALEARDASFIPYGEARVVGVVESVELEYAAIRKRVALFDAPQRGLIRLTGAERQDFLHRMLTCNVNALQPGDVTRGFLLNVKGRIMADMLVAHFDDATLIDLDLPDAPAVAAELDKLLFGEDVQIADLSDSHHRVSLHGPMAGGVVEWWRDTVGGGGEQADAWHFRYDETGETGVHLWAPAERIAPIGEKLDDLAEVFKLRPIGWLAYNIARVEAGMPLFHVDFGPSNLPHETGSRLLADAVSFTKGCYRGQEIVARMQSLGHPAKILVGFRADGGEVPVSETPLLDADSADAATVGAVTSSTYAPMMSQTPVGFAMVKWGKHADGSTLFAPTESGSRLPVTVQDMRFYTRG